MCDWDAAERAVTAAADWPEAGPGGAVLLFDREGLRATAAAGVESLANGRAITPDSVMRCASITKHVFASFVLAQADTVALGDPLGRHLPQLAPALAGVTVGRALDMTGGIPDTRECLTLLGLTGQTRSEAPALLALHAALERLNYPAGTEVHYSNGGYRLVEAALCAHGRHFDDFLAAELRDPLGLPIHAPEMWTDPVPGLVPGHVPGPGGAGWQTGFQGMHLSAAGSLAASPRALAEWGRLLLRGEGAFAGRLDALGAPRSLADGRVTGYGLGLRHHVIGTHAMIGHGGSQSGYKAYLLLDRAAGAGCVVMANRDDVDAGALAARVMAALRGAALPVAGSDLVPGLYVAPEGADWIEVGAASVSRLDDEVAVHPQPGGGVDSLSPTSPLRLRMQGAEAVGEVGHAPARFVPATAEAVPDSLTGRWFSPFGAMLEIADGAVRMGVGPLRQVTALQPLGGGRWLFTRRDGAAMRRICLHHVAPDRLTLALSRARVIDYRKG